jgi:3-methyl-2-oxobutanoate hydroxymethyltransferase
MNFIPSFKNKKKLSEPLVLMTAYDAWSAKVCDSLGFDALLVGDSVAMTVHGFENTIPATLEMMRFHVESVARGARKTFIIGDLPFMSYRKGFEVAIQAAETLMRAGAHAIKLEGCLGNQKIIQHLVESGIPVMGHLGLTPQHVYAMGGFKVQGREASSAEALMGQARELQNLGCFSLVLECVPTSLAGEVTRSLEIPVIGIGAGPLTDGQILVFHDVLGLNETEKKIKFVRKYLDGNQLMKNQLQKFKQDVESKQFPVLAESYDL